MIFFGSPGSAKTMNPPYLFPVDPINLGHKIWNVKFGNIETFLFMHRINPMKREQITAVLVDFCNTKLVFQVEKKTFLVLPWKNLRLLIWQKNIFIILR